ncbi:MAG: energy transducer TonB [Balneolales bacterium]
MKLLNRKNPGADIHSNYKLQMEISLIGVLLILIIVFRINWQPSNNFEIKERTQEVVSLEEIIQTEQIVKPPAPPRPSAPVSVPNDMILEDDVFDLGTDDYIFDAPMDMPPPPPPEEDSEEDEEIFFVVEDMPEMVGGLESVYSYLVYPEVAKRAGIQGRVTIQFVIDEQGIVRSPEVLRGIGGGCDEAAITAIQKTKFTPGRQRGRPVKVQYTMSVHFKLENA